jgi:AraC-like DNA-binding protein
MPRAPTYTGADLERFKELLRQRLTLAEVANQTGLSTKVVLSAIKKHEGLTIREFRDKYSPITYTDQDVRHFRQLLMEGLSAQEVGQRLGFTEGQVRYAIKRDEGLTILQFRQRYRPIDVSRQHDESTPRDPKWREKRVRLPTTNKPIGRPRKAYTKTCPFCGTRFKTKNANQVYCSLSCTAKSSTTRNRRPRPTIQEHCARCAKAFLTKRPEQKYCGNACRNACISTDKTSLTEIPCAFCHKIFRPTQRIVRFCSRECAYKGRKPSGHVSGLFKSTGDARIAFHSSYELVFLLYAFDHPKEYYNLRRCDFSIRYEFQGAAPAYFPDFAAEDTNGRTSIFEIKSTGTIERDPEKTEAKTSAAGEWCRDNGIHFVYLTDRDDAFIAMCDYVASHHELDVLKRVDDAESLRKILKYCMECGKPIARRGEGIGAYLRRKFCSAHCRDTSPHGKKQRLPTSRHICAQCKREFYGHKRKVYCSKECYTNAQRTLKERECPVCGRHFQPKSFDKKTCGIECGIILRSARLAGRSIHAQVQRLHNVRKKKEVEQKRASPASWTLDMILERLRDIRDHLGGRVPTYSEIYRRTSLRTGFGSCALAGAIFRFNQENGIGTYNEFVFRYLGWIPPDRLTAEMTLAHLDRVIREYGGVPTDLPGIKDLLGVRGSCLESAFKRHFGTSITAYCRANNVRRVAPGEPGLI